MPRLFVALRPPPPIRAQLAAAMGGVADARWQDDEQLHLTLRFLGEVAAATGDDLVAALGQVHAPAPVVALAGGGRFERRGRTDTLWAGVTPHDALAHLHRKVDQACLRAGLAPDGRAYLPHITLARLSRGAGYGLGIERWLADHAVLTSTPFALPHLVLYESLLGRGGATYQAVMRWPLDAADAMPGEETIMRHAILLLAVPAALAGCTHEEMRTGAPLPGGRRATAMLVTGTGAPAGRATVTEVAGGLRVTLDARGLPPGTHGAHLHTVGACVAPDFASAGGHWNPMGAKHGSMNPQGPHAGDLPNLIVGADGRGTLGVTLASATLDGLLDADGAALVVHAAADDLMTDPSGNSGARLACGVLSAG